MKAQTPFINFTRLMKEFNMKAPIWPFELLFEDGISVVCLTKAEAEREIKIHGADRLIHLKENHKANMVATDENEWGYKRAID
jgi:hypothetical protein